MRSRDSSRCNNLMKGMAILRVVFISTEKAGVVPVQPESGCPARCVLCAIGIGRIRTVRKAKYRA